MAPVETIPRDGARDETSEAALAAAFKTGDCRRVTRLYPEWGRTRRPLQASPIGMVSCLRLVCSACHFWSS